MFSGPRLSLRSKTFWCLPLRPEKSFFLLCLQLQGTATDILLFVMPPTSRYSYRHTYFCYAPTSRYSHRQTYFCYASNFRVQPQTYLFLLCLQLEGTATFILIFVMPPTSGNFDPNYLRTGEIKWAEIF